MSFITANGEVYSWNNLSVTCPECAQDMDVDLMEDRHGYDLLISTCYQCGVQVDALTGIRTDDYHPEEEDEAGYVAGWNEQPEEPAFGFLRHALLRGAAVLAAAVGYARALLRCRRPVFPPPTPADPTSILEESLHTERPHQERPDQERPHQEAK